MAGRGREGADEIGVFKDRKRDPSPATNNRSLFGVYYLLEKLPRLQAAKHSRMECGRVLGRVYKKK